MQISEVRDMSEEELDRQIDELRETLFNLRFRTAIGQETDTSQFRKTRRDLARMLTIRRERGILSVENAQIEGQND